MDFMGKTKILIVDDNKSVSSSIQMGLELTGDYEVVVENDPLRAKAHALQYMPDLILMDVIMPEKDGGTVAAEIRETRPIKDIPIIFLTSIVGKDEAAELGGWIGDEPFLAKPCSIEELTARIEQELA